jgi:uncharacterized protein
MMVCDPSGSFLTQRQIPKLCLVNVAIDAENVVSINLPTDPSTAIPVIPNSPTSSRGRVWDDAVSIQDLNSDAAAALSTFVDRKVRIVRTAPDYTRPMEFAEDFETAFTDAGQLMIVSEQSLTALNARLAEPLPMERFRPNLVVRCSNAFEEDTWKTIEIGTPLRVSAPP